MRARLPYERRDDESARAFSAFEHYRNMPPARRTLDGAYQEFTGHTARASGHWKDWHRNFDWIARAAEWDRAQDAAARKAMMEQAVTARRRQANALRAMQEVLSRPAQELLERIVTRRIDLTRLGDGELLKIALAAAAVMPRLAQAELVALGEQISVESEEQPQWTQQPAQVDGVEERAAQVWAVLEDVGIQPRPVEIVAEEAVVRELPRRAAG
jgi:hypothetical protein